MQVPPRSSSPENSDREIARRRLVQRAQDGGDGALGVAGAEAQDAAAVDARA